MFLLINPLTYIESEWLNVLPIILILCLNPASQTLLQISTRLDPYNFLCLLKPLHLIISAFSHCPLSAKDDSRVLLINISDKK